MGQPTVFDRCFQYGDGVFTTIKVLNGQLQFWSLHWQRLVHSCERLGIQIPLESLVLSAAQQAILQPNQVVKVIISRGIGGRGYSTQGIENSEFYILTSALPAPSPTSIRLGVATLQLGIQPRLAGIKHCSRLETVMLKSEAEHSGFDDLVVTDSEGFVIECTAANLFFYYQGRWHTPALDRAGVAGIMRTNILQQIGIQPGHYPLAVLAQAEAMFLCNALIGIRPVHQFQLTPVDVALVHQLQSLLRLDERE